MMEKFRNRNRMMIFGCIGAGIVAAVVVISVLFWGWLSGEESGSTTIRNIALVVAGAIALGLALWRSVVAERQANTAQHGLLNERYQKGAEMLGSGALSVRLGGIYALQHLAEEHPELYHIQVMDLFCAFLRHPTKDQELKPRQIELEPGTLLGLRADVEGILKAIGCRAESRIAIERRAGLRLDFRGVDLPHAQLLDADLSNAMFHHARLPGANIANADLTDALFDYSDLSGAQFRNVSCHRTRFFAADLSEAMLQDAELPIGSFHCANLSGANLRMANLYQATFQDAVATGASLEGANLSRAGFLGADLSGARLMKADLSGAGFLDANLSQSNISDADLTGVEFSVGGPQKAKGLTQTQLDQARADSANPPTLTGVLDAETGDQLVWSGGDFRDQHGV